MTTKKPLGQVAKAKQKNGAAPDDDADNQKADSNLVCLYFKSSIFSID